MNPVGTSALGRPKNLDSSRPKAPIGLKATTAHIAFLERQNVSQTVALPNACRLMVYLAVMNQAEPHPSTRTHETAILSRVVRADVPSFPPEAARAILEFHFPDSDRMRMKELSERAREGALSPSDEKEIESYRHVGHLLELLWSKARLSLKG